MEKETIIFQTNDSKKIEVVFEDGTVWLTQAQMAELYGGETKVLNQAVSRNIERFPEDFMFQLTKDEFENWKSQFVISNSIVMGARKLPYAFTEHGISMLSGVLHSPIAIEANIRIMRAFVGMRHFIDDEAYHIGASLKDLGKKWFAFSILNFSKEEILVRIK